MTPELEKAYRDSTRPFIDGAIDEKAAQQKSWRYFLEVNSLCNLHCVMCTKGNQAGYDHKTGIMDPELMEKIIDKIASENPNAIVFLYGNSEPFLHPKLPECIASIKKRGLRCEFASNLNYMQRVDETLAARPDMIIVSLSGWSQEVYEKSHCGGKIEKVKANMRILGEANARSDTPVHISVNYHVYRDNGGAELDAMRSYAAECGLGFFTSTARVISMENAIQYCREKEGQNGFDAGVFEFPPTSDKFRATIDRLKIPPTKAKEMYGHLPVQGVCPVGSGGMFTFIRHDGGTCLCPCVADRRLKLTDFLDATPDSLIEERVNSPVCQQCKTYKLNYYFHIVDRDKWE